MKLLGFAALADAALLRSKTGERMEKCENMHMQVAQDGLSYPYDPSYYKLTPWVDDRFLMTWDCDLLNDAWLANGRSTDYFTAVNPATGGSLLV